ncbi:MAG: S-layer homology domain-containing protein [Oscillospiraceae bacterium]|nr:S-layer homology domain-containing protein [Oscillospiraceae bacterium]
MKHMRKSLTALALLLCLTLELALPLCVRADAMTVSDACLNLIRHYEGYSDHAYQNGGKWFIGYGTQIDKDAYPNGISETEAAELMRGTLRSSEERVRVFASQRGIQLTQGQFDALVDFTYTLGTAWMNGNSLVRRLVTGEVELSRRETARAFGVWCHSGGAVLPGLARRRLEEAALYLDGSTEAASTFCYLAIEREEGVAYATDFGVYERGGTYDAFPTMLRLGYSISGVETDDGTVLRLGDTATKDLHVRVLWEKAAYSNAYPDVAEERWYYDYVMALSEAGVVNGHSDGSFQPELSTTTGEALKLILLAAGHAPQPSVGSHWASGYAAYAQERGYLSSAVLSDLNAPITRRDVARLAAGALGFGQSFSASPFDDVNDGYVTALAEIGVLEGSTEDGKTLFHGDDPLSRAEASTIVWRLLRAVALDTKQTVQYGARTLSVADVPLNRYDKSLFSGKNDTMTYNDPAVTVLRGVDASRYQGEVDWAAAAADCIDFAILRVGGRYQMSGEIYEDTKFEQYYADASAAGLKIGAYFYSQAISIEEAVEEAEYVLAKLKGKQIDAPVVFDWETAESLNARTNGLPSNIVSDCAVAYCERIRDAGYTPMIYMNTYDGYIKYDLSRLGDYDIWYAGQYGGAYPKFIYDFVMWQYTDRGSVDGFKGAPDMDLWFIR